MAGGGAAECAQGDSSFLPVDVTASCGVLAHVAVLYPFVPSTAVDEKVVNRLAVVFAAASPSAGG